MFRAMQEKRETERQGQEAPGLLRASWWPCAPRLPLVSWGAQAAPAS